MPAYDYRCRTCDTRFEVRRGVDEPEVPVDCPRGHGATSRIFTPVAVGGAASAPATPAASGGCCGGGCCG
ncbi:MAG: zinc ribbon domain-containing protein [Actinobacteria bacterium]|nr:zinc ribbon domain-containing protein [Actinomycetota bacterium]